MTKLIVKSYCIIEIYCSLKILNYCNCMSYENQLVGFIIFSYSMLGDRSELIFLLAQALIRQKSY